MGLAVIHNTLNVLLIAYLTLVVGTEPALAGSLVLIAKLYDVVTDLPMGWLTDHTHTRWGARRPYLFVAGFVTPVAMVMLFSPPVGDDVVFVENSAKSVQYGVLGAGKRVTVAAPLATSVVHVHVSC